MEYYRRSDTTQGEAEVARKRLERQLERERERDMYRWEDLTEGEYKRRRDDLRRQLDALNPVPSGSDNLPRLAQFLADVSSAWESATAEQQNKLARTLFEEIWIKDKEVVFVKPRPELDPFFRLNYEESTRKAVEGVTSTRVELGLKHGLAVLVAMSLAGVPGRSLAIK